MKDVAVDLKFYETQEEAVADYISCTSQEDYHYQYWYLCPEVDGFDRLNACFTCPCDNTDCEGERTCYYYDTNPEEDDICPINGISQYQGNPINIFNGSKIEKVPDLTFSSPFKGGFIFSRNYHSWSDKDSPIGFGWGHIYRIIPFVNPYEDYCWMRDENGKYYMFQKFGSETGYYGGILSTQGHVEIVGDVSMWFRENGRIYSFQDGRLIAIDDGEGNSQALTYNAEGLLERVLDSATGRSILFSYNANGKLISITGPSTASVPDGIWVTYDYDDKGNLVTVRYADDDNGSDSSGFHYSYDDPNDD
ncbi:MAG: RHS repeat protein, partial [Deltaproteobacteria bacterium]|nr:RHS repeat protein [Deltaproteobacteria bacterium]